MWPGCARAAAAFSLASPARCGLFADAGLEDAQPLVIGITGAQCAWS